MLIHDARWCRHDSAGFASAALRGGASKSRGANEVASIAEVDDEKPEDLSASSRRGKSKRFPKPTPRDWAVLQGELCYDEPEIQATAWYYALQKVLDNRTVVIDGKKVWAWLTNLGPAALVLVQNAPYQP